MRSTIPLLSLLLLGFLIEDGKPSSNRIDFQQQIRPLLSKHCFSCHGPSKQSAGLRLDLKKVALAGGDDGPVIVPGKSAESKLFQMVSATEKGKVMPPKGEKLSAEEMAKIKLWIDQGANWPDDGSEKNTLETWWSFKPIVSPEVSKESHPVDYFINLKLKEKGFNASSEAERRTLIRRLYFDLLGLPPTPEAVQQFVADKSPNSYEKLVEELLASPHYGERWARHWLDVVHFGETHGYDKDKPRPNGWPYRDYVIRSFNADKPYRQFIQEQIAGDTLSPYSTEAISALGFLAAGPWDFIGHEELPESKIDGKIARHLDRDDFVANTMSTFMGLTVHCAQCHNHKFDPITQEEYYKLQSVFAAIDRTNKPVFPSSEVAKNYEAKEKELKTLTESIQQLEAKARSNATKEWDELQKQLADAGKPATFPPEHGYHSKIETDASQAKWVQIDLGSTQMIDKILLRPCHDDFNKIGSGFGFPVRFQVEVSDNESFQPSHIVLAETKADFPNPGLNTVTVASINKPARYLRIIATKLAPRLNDFIFALAEVEVLDKEANNLAIGKKVTAQDSIEAPSRWSKSNLTDGKFPQPAPKVDTAKLQLKKQHLLTTTLGQEAYTRYTQSSEAIPKLQKELSSLFKQSQPIYIGAVHSGSGTFTGTGSNQGKPRPIHLLHRGNVTQPKQEVFPAGIASIPNLPADWKLPKDHNEATRRAALAQWLSSDNNPLTWRVMANRVWQYHFGQGLVATPNDFGKMGQLPSHPELLDYLAHHLKTHQSIKQLHRLIVTSSAYRQASSFDPLLQKKDNEQDSGNVYLWRQNRRKLEAEAVRDAMLQVSGRLQTTLHGPSFQDFIIEKPEHSPHYQYHLHDPEDTKTHRRSIYRFIVRSKSQPFMTALDCADPSMNVDKRNQSNSPQQALALLNNPLSLVLAKHFALRLEAKTKNLKQQIAQAFRWALQREPTAEESTLWQNYTTEFGLANTCRMIFNLNEFVFID